MFTVTGGPARHLRFARRASRVALVAHLLRSPERFLRRNKSYLRTARD